MDIQQLRGEIGVKWPCFGEFSCGLCERKWGSVRAWKNYGQKCKSCNIEVKARSLQPLVYYCCVPCQRFWKNKPVEDGIACQQCRKIIHFKSYEEFQLFWLPSKFKNKENGNIDLMKRHLSEYCQKCIALGPEMCCSGYPALNPTLPNTISKHINGRDVHIQVSPNPASICALDQPETLIRSFNDLNLKNEGGSESKLSEDQPRSLQPLVFTTAASPVSDFGRINR